MSAHTRGPWEVQAGNLTAESGRCILASLHTWDEDAPEEGAANARLIAAAPELLEALRKAVVLIAGACVHAPELEPQETYEVVSAAIAKATGACA